MTAHPADVMAHTSFERVTHVFSLRII